MNKMNIISLGVTLAIPGLLAACGQRMGPNPQQGGYMMNMPFGGLFMILVLLAIVVFIAMVLKGVTRRDQTLDSPLDIIKRRYASGEIDKDEFERLKKGSSG